MTGCHRQPESGTMESANEVTGWRAGGTAARKTGAPFAYRSKGHDRPVKGWRGPCLFWGGWSGIPPPGDAGGTEKMQGT